MPLQGCMQTSASRDQPLSWVRSDFIVLEVGSESPIQRIYANDHE